MDNRDGPANAITLLEVLSTDEDDAAPRLREPGGWPFALGSLAAVCKQHESQDVLCRVDIEPDEVRFKLTS
jgi:hypothetical protein